MTPQHASKVRDGFPYGSKAVCYVEVASDGTVQQGGGNEVYKRVLAGKSKLYAVWPGRWSSDLFLIDDIEAYARELGFSMQKNNHIHDVEWKMSEHQYGSSSTYVDVDVKLLCGCKIDDNILPFAIDMRDQKGWDVATSTGWSGHGLGDDMEYTIRVRRKSLGVQDNR